MPGSVIAEDLTVEGNIRSNKGSVEIKGTVTGDITGLSIIIRDTGSVNGALSAKTVIIEGQHEGRIDCDDLTVSNPAKLQSQITAKTMTAENGVEMNGHLRITGLD